MGREDEVDLDELHERSKRSLHEMGTDPSLRMRQVVHLVGKYNCTNGEVAERLGLHYLTACEHLRRARDNAGLHTLTPREAAHYLYSARPNVYEWEE